MSPNNKASRIAVKVGLVVALAGIAVLGLATGRAASTYTFLKTAIVTQAQVADNQQQLGGQNGRTYRPTFAFDDQAGQRHEVQSDAGSSEWGFAVGQTVEVVYDPDNPQDVRLNTFGGLWSWAAILAGMGAVVMVLGLVVAASAHKTALRAKSPTQPAQPDEA
ncbi:MAG: DUF3592 domain-containing protein [Planctomycetota bacterium]